MGSLHKPSRHHRNRRAFSGELEPLLHHLYGFEIADQDTSALQHWTLLIEADLHQPLLGLAVFLRRELLALRGDLQVPPGADEGGEGALGAGAVCSASSGAPWRSK